MSKKLNFVEAVEEIIKTMDEYKKIYPEMKDVNLEEVRKGLMARNMELKNCLYDPKELREFVARKVEEHMREFKKGN